MARHSAFETMTNNPEDPAEPLTVLFDGECGLCRRLAEYGRSRSEGALIFIAWQDFAQRPEAQARFGAEACEAPPAHLRVLRGDEIQEDQDAWAAILAAYPPFESLSWIAERLGLLGTVSRVTYYGGQWLRGHCGECP